MSKLPAVRVLPPNARDRERLRLWLHEWEIDQVLRTTPPDGADESSGQPALKTANGSGAPVAAPADAASLRVGQIRLLHPGSERHEAERTLYVALLEETAEQGFLVAPFGRFSQPALPGEWLTGFRALALRVLCLWSARTVERRALARSWHAGTMKPGQVAAAMEVYRLIHAGGPFPPNRSRRTGPPLVHPLDPRLTYQAEEADAFECALRATEEPLRTATAAGPTNIYELPLTEQRLAAETRATYGASGKGRKKPRK